jgi:Protein of unknown function (DUF2442)
MCKIVEVKPLPGFHVWLKYQDGVQGEVDLSRLAGKGVFSAWNRQGCFEEVFIAEESGALAWPGGIDLCPDSLYEELTGRALPEQAASNA